MKGDMKMAPFPPILAVALGAVAVAFLVRHNTREWQRARDIERDAEASVAKARGEVAPRKLRRDADGVYRP
jgi:hypothetical protein